MNNANENPYFPFYYDRNCVFNQNYYLSHMGQGYQYQNNKNINGINCFINPSIQPNTPMVQQNYYNWQPAFNAVQYTPYGHDSEIKYNTFNCPTEPNKIFQNNLEDGKVKKIRRDRTTYTKPQLQILENYFQKNSYPDVTVRENIAAQIHISELNIQVWFKNRRAKQKRLSGKTNGVDKSTINGEESLSNNIENTYINKTNSNKEIITTEGHYNSVYPSSNVKGEHKSEPYDFKTENYHFCSYNNNFIVPNVNNKDQNYYNMNYSNYLPPMDDPQPDIL